MGSGSGEAASLLRVKGESAGTRTCVTLVYHVAFISLFDSLDDLFYNAVLLPLSIDSTPFYMYFIYGFVVFVL